MKSLATLLLMFFYFSSVSIFAQKSDENIKEVFLDAEFFLMNEDYSDALFNYIKIYNKGFKENGNINYRIGQCYLKISTEKDKAIPYLEKAVQYCNSNYQEGLFKETHAPYDAYYYLGTAYRLNNQFDKAAACYEKFKNIYEARDQDRTNLALQEIEACKFASEQIQKTENIITLKLDSPVSTNNSDIYPVVSGNLNNLVYVSKLKFYDAIYYCNKNNGKWSVPINITSSIKSDGDQYPTFLSFDGSELYLRKEDNFEADLMMSKKVNGEWTKSQNLGKNINSKYWEGNISVTKDGKTLFFSSNRKNGVGSMDIYKSTRMADGEWGVPVNLGSKINTIYNEDTPYITEDGSRLYFISQGHKNMGGYDIFYCNISRDGQLSEPVHLGYPINTADDDLYFYPLKNGEMAYTALTQKNNPDFEDIFEVYINPGKELLATLGRTSREDTVEIRMQKQTLPLFATTDAESVHAMINPVESSNIPSEMKDENPIILPIIFFEFNSFELSENGKKSLDYIATVFKNYNDIKFQFTGHTDAIGSNRYNYILSEKRALAAKHYLVKKGLSSGVILIKGMGENSFIAVNSNPDGSDNPEGRKFNRRVEVKVLEDKPDKKIIMQDLNIPKNLKIAQP